MWNRYEKSIAVLHPLVTGDSYTSAPKVFTDTTETILDA